MASIQKRTSPIKFDHLAEKSESGSISNLSTKIKTRPAPEAWTFGSSIDVRRNGDSTLTAREYSLPSAVTCRFPV